ncbi:MAG: hypothetical protein ACOCUT_01275 [bacterium]
MINKIQKLNGVLEKKENSELKGAKQDQILFTAFTKGKIKELEKELLEKHNIQGKGKVLGLAVLNLLSELKEKDGKKTKNI